MNFCAHRFHVAAVLPQAVDRHVAGQVGQQLVDLAERGQRAHRLGDVGGAALRGQDAGVELAVDSIRQAGADRHAVAARRVGFEPRDVVEDVGVLEQQLCDGQRLAVDAELLRDFQEGGEIRAEGGHGQVSLSGRGGCYVCLLRACSAAIRCASCCSLDPVNTGASFPVPATNPLSPPALPMR